MHFCTRLLPSTYISDKAVKSHAQNSPSLQESQGSSLGQDYTPRLFNMANNNVQIMTLNVGGPSRKGIANERRNFIRSFQPQLQQCSVIFVQECNGEDRKNLMRILGRGYQKVLRMVILT